MPGLKRCAALVACVLLVACEKSEPPSPSPGPGSGETITGRERIGWDQRAADASELATFRYAIYVDGTRSELADATCATAAGANGFPCSGRLPAMNPGAHTLELAAFVVEGGSVIESAKSPPLRVTVAGATTPVASDPLRTGEQITTADGVRLVAQLLATGFEDPSDIAIAPDGRVFVASRDGRIHVLESTGRIRDAVTIPGTARPGALLAVTLDPDFTRTRHVFVAYATTANDSLVFQTARYREVKGRLVERVLVLPDIPAAAEPAAALRFGPDGKLYAAFDSGGNADAAVRRSDWRGKILRLEPDGRTPADQPAASPVFWAGLSRPRGLAWTEGAATIWTIDEGADSIERIRAIGSTSQPSRRSEQRASYVLPRPLGASALAMYAAGDIPQFAGDLLIAGRAGGYLLRVRFDPADPLRAVSSERLLEDRLGPVHAVAVGPAGGIYVCSPDALWRLTRAR